MPHLGAGYNLARWLVRSPQDAEDIVQESYLRAFRAFERYRGGDPRAWLLSIVRNTSYSWLRRRGELVEGSLDPADFADDVALGPEARLISQSDGLVLRHALDRLPVEYREVMVLRELEGLSYREIAEITGAPLGTVMSRLSRARRQLQNEVRKRTEGADR